MIYCLLEPIYWDAFDPPTPCPEHPVQMTMRPGVLRGPGLDLLLGRDFFDRLVDAKFLEPIP